MELDQHTTDNCIYRLNKKVFLMLFCRVFVCLTRWCFFHLQDIHVKIKFKKNNFNAI